jgi:hypothetical protein
MTPVVMPVMPAGSSVLRIVSQRQARLAQSVWKRAQRVNRQGGDRRQDHDRKDDTRGDEAKAIGEKSASDEVICFADQWHNQQHREDAIDDGRNACQQFQYGLHELPPPRRRDLRDEDCHSERNWRCEDHGQQCREETAHNKNENADMAGSVRRVALIGIVFCPEEEVQRIEMVDGEGLEGARGDKKNDRHNNENDDARHRREERLADLGIALHPSFPGRLRLLTLYCRAHPLLPGSHRGARTISDTYLQWTGLA